MPRKSSSAKSRAQKKNKSQGSLKLSILLSFISLIAPVVAGLCIYPMLAKTLADRDTTIANAYAALSLSEFEQLIQQPQATLNNLGRLTKLGLLIEQSSNQEISAYTESLLTQLPNATSLRAHKRGAATVDNSTHPPINFQTLKLINTNLKGLPTYPEVHQIDTDAILRLVSPIYSSQPNSHRIIGTLSATINIEKLISQYQPASIEFGQVSIQQKFLSSPARKIYTSASQGGNIAQTVSLKSAIPHFTLTFELKNTYVDTPFNLIAYWLIISACSIVVFVIAITIHKILRKQASSDLKILEKHMAQATSGQSTDQPTFKLPGFSEAAEHIAGLINTLVTATATTTPQASRADKMASLKKAAKSHTLTATDSQPAGNKTKASTLQKGESGSTEQTIMTASTEAPESIFRAYDIRGIVGETLTPEIIYNIGKAIGSEAITQDQHSMVVGRDGRLSGPELSAALIDGILSTGCNVINIDMVATPILYYATHELKTQSGVMLTGSHNPANYNGLKIVINGSTLAEDGIKNLYERIKYEIYAEGIGKLTTKDVKSKYVDRILEDIVLIRKLKIVIDCGNGAAGVVATDLFTQLGCQVTSLYCDVDGNFPNHHPDPSRPENLEALKNTVIEKKADLGIAFDGDGDRLGIVTTSGKIIYADRLLMLIVRDILARNPGADIIYDVKCSRDLGELITKLGGNPIMWKTGHSLIKSKLKETGALFAGEMSGHIFFNDRWYGFDDALYSAARVLEIISMERFNSDELFAEFPEKECTPELNIPVSEDKKFAIIEAIKSQGDFGDGTLNDIDGVRVEFPNSWGLVRASNTTPMLVTRFEADDKESLDAIMTMFKKCLHDIDDTLEVPF